MTNTNKSMEVNTTKTSVYAEKIFSLAQDKKNEIFYNSSAEHAIVVHQALMKTAEKYVCIFSSSMCSEISNNTEYISYVRKFLEGNKDRYIRILLTDYTDEFLQTKIAKLFAHYPQQVQVKKYDGNVYYKNVPAHFTVTDDRAFRLETDIEKHMAFGNFGSKEQACTLKEVFDKMFISKLASNVTYC